MTTLQNEVNPAQNIVKMQTPFQRFVADYFESRIATVAFAVLLVILFIGVFASVISPTDPYDLAVVDVMDSRLPPGTEGYTGMTFWLGTDGAGRDLSNSLYLGFFPGNALASAAFSVV